MQTTEALNSTFVDTLSHCTSLLGLISSAGWVESFKLEQYEKTALLSTVTIEAKKRGQEEAESNELRLLHGTN